MGIEIHPFEIFHPIGMKHLIIGSFTSKDAARGVEYDWYYSNGRNHFWRIIESVYSVDLPNKDAKVKLFTQLQIGVTDIIYKCNRVRLSSLDNDLEIIELNSQIPHLLSSRLVSVYFTSRYVEQLFTKNFSSLVTNHPETNFIYLPSPSPRYASMTKDAKVEQYKKLLPTYTK